MPLNVARRALYNNKERQGDESSQRIRVQGPTWNGALIHGNWQQLQMELNAHKIKVTVVPRGSNKEIIVGYLPSSSATTTDRTGRKLDWKSSRNNTLPTNQRQDSRTAPSQRLPNVAGNCTQAFATPDNPRDERNGEPITARIRDGSTPLPSDSGRFSFLHPAQDHRPTRDRVSDSNDADEDADPKSALTVITADDGEAILQLTKGKASEAFGSRGKF